MCSNEKTARCPDIKASVKFLSSSSKSHNSASPVRRDCQCFCLSLADEYAPPGPPSPAHKVRFGASVGPSGDVETSPPPPRGFVYSALSNPGRMRSSDIIFLRSNQARRPVKHRLKPSSSVSQPLPTSIPPKKKKKISAV